MKASRIQLIRLLLACLGLAFAGVALVVGVWFWQEWKFQKEWEAANAELAAAGLPVTPEEMIPEEIDPQDNAAPLLLRAYELLEAGQKEGVIEEWTAYKVQESASDPAAMAGLLEKISAPPIREILNLVGEATERPACRFERNWEEDYAMDLQGISPLLSLGQLLRCRSILLAWNGDFQGAWSDLQSLFRLGDFADEDPVLISFLVKISLEQMALETLESILLAGGAHHIPKETLHKLAAELLHKSEQNRIGLVRALDGERILFATPVFKKLRSGEYFADQIFQQSALLEPAENKKKISVQFRAAAFAYQYPLRGWLNLDQKAMLEAHKKLRQIAASPPFDEEGAFVDEAVDSFFHEIPHFAFLTRLMMPVFGGVLSRSMEMQASYQLAQLGLAAALFEQEHGRPPANLEEIPDLFGATNRIDPFSGQPFVWLSGEDGEILLYSFGRNGEDNGGTRTGRRNSRDIVWQIQSATPPSK